MQTKKDVKRQILIIHFSLMYWIMHWSGAKENQIPWKFGDSKISREAMQVQTFLSSSHTGHNLQVCLYTATFTTSDSDIESQPGRQDNNIRADANENMTLVFKIQIRPTIFQIPIRR
ncbi:hypothetical protein ACJX0J_036375, partial [Zea mays]